MYNLFQTTPIYLHTCINQYIMPQWKIGNTFYFNYKKDTDMGLTAIKQALLYCLLNSDTFTLTSLHTCKQHTCMFPLLWDMSTEETVTNSHNFNFALFDIGDKRLDNRVSAWVDICL